MTTVTQADGLIHLALYLYAESPVRAGGDKDAHVDLPLQRDSVTGFPVIHGQSLKGALKRHGGLTPEQVRAAFGSDPTDPGESSAGSVSVHEAHVVALPLATTARIFAWVTCPLALHRVNRTRARTGAQPLSLPPLTSDQFRHADPDTHTPYRHPVLLGPVVVDDLAHDPAATDCAATIADEAFPDETQVLKPFADKFSHDLVIAGDSVGGHLLRRASVEITRNNTTGGKTVPFDDEYLPEESLLIAPLSLPPTMEVPGSEHPLTAAEVVDSLHGQVLQVGADRSVGKGLMWMSVLGQVN